MRQHRGNIFYEEREKNYASLDYGGRDAKMIEAGRQGRREFGGLYEVENSN